MNRVMRLAPVKNKVGEVGGVTEPVSPDDVVVSSGDAGSPISSGVPEPVEDGSAVSAPQASRTALRAARRALPGLAAGEVPSGEPCGARRVRRCPGGPASRDPSALSAAAWAACVAGAVCGLCPGCMPSGCAPAGPGRRGRRRPCGKRSQKASCGDRNDSTCHRIRLGSRLGPVVASPPQHSADRSGVSGRRDWDADFACLHPSTSGRPSGRHGRGPDRHGSSW